MLTGHRSAWRRRGKRSSAARIAVPLAIPMALGLTLGVVIAVSGSHGNTTINPAAAAAAAANAAPSFANGHTARHTLGDLATNPVDGTGAPINMNQDAAAAATTMNCTLKVPDHPLSARGLATPWQLGDGCSMQNFGTQGAFVEATIIAPNGAVQVYNPLVITAGTTPAAAPVRSPASGRSPRRLALPPSSGQARAACPRNGTARWWRAPIRRLKSGSANTHGTWEWRFN